MKPVLIILNGQLNNELNSIEISSYSEIVCADGAIDNVDFNKLEIKKVFGDFDSIITKIDSLDYIELRDQDFTDFEKILMYYLNLNITKFHVAGSSGKEQDHFLGHLSIAKKYLNRAEILFFDSHQEYFVIDRGIELNDCLNKMISVIPLPEVHGLSYKGLQYELESEILTFGERIGTRNKAVDNQIIISFDKGCLAIFKEK